MSSEISTNYEIKKRKEYVKKNVLICLSRPVDILLCFPTGETKQGDLAYSAFNMIAQIHSQTLLQSCRFTGATEVYICGNLFNSEFVREQVLKSKSMQESMYAFVSSVLYKVRYYILNIYIYEVILLVKSEINN